MPNNTLFRRIIILAAILILFPCSRVNSKALQAKVAADQQVVMKDEEMEVTLDSHFPRVFEYRVRDRSTLLGALRSARPSVELNGVVYTPAEFTVVTQVTPISTTYRITFPALHLALTVRFELRPSEVLMRLLNVEENGSFRLNTLYFPDHFLVRMSSLTPDAKIYRGEYHRRPWNNPNLPGSYSDSIPHFAAIANEDAEQFPVRVNWAAAYTSDVCATIANNIGTWKLASQFLGFGGQASDFALWNWVYHYRLRGTVQPLLTVRIAILSRDVNGDGRVDWMEAALWQHALFPNPNPLYSRPTYVYKIINAFGPPNNEPVTTFEECLQIIQSIARITGGLPQIVYLVGWQYDGHDTGYPSMDKINPTLGGASKLRWLAREAKKYNAIISYHINLDDSYQEHPDWDLGTLCLRRDGKPYSRGFNPEVNLSRYLISHTKEVESGYFQKRAQAFLNAVPVENTVHLDTLECTGVSFGPDEYIGVNDELELGCKFIFKWFADRGIDVSTESPFDRFYGTLSWFLHKQEIRDPFQIMMIHGKAYGGGKPEAPVEELLGWSTDMPVMAHLSKAYPMYSAYSVTQTSDTFYLGTLLQYYLDKKELIFLGSEGDSYVARFKDGTVSRQRKGEPVLVRNGNVVIAQEQDRLIPLNNSEIRLYSASGGEHTWILPEAWTGAQVTLSALQPDGTHDVSQFQIDKNYLTLVMEAHRPYILHK